MILDNHQSCKKINTRVKNYEYKIFIVIKFLYNFYIYFLIIF